MSAKRLIVLTNDLPYPPTYGHKVDQYYRWRAFAARGWRLRLICWRSPLDAPATDADGAALRDVFEAIDILPIAHSAGAFARRLGRLWRYPSHVAARVPDRDTRARLIADAQAFGPAAIVLDGIYGGVAGEALARVCGVPIIVRGHNIEHLYFQQQARAARDVRSRVAWSLARLGLARYEAGLITRAAWTVDISADDVAYWQGRGVARISWAPTVFSRDHAVTLLPPAQKRWDVAYIGNLRLPNNVRGIAWFVREVMPHLRVLRPGIRCVFAGADPGPAALALFAGAPDIDLIANAANADDILANGRVLVNPILSGSGVTVKAIDMLRYDAPIVTTSVGARGFGPEAREQFRIHDDPARFAHAVVSALADPYPPAGRSSVRRPFGEDGIARQTALIARIAGI